MEFQLAQQRPGMWPWVEVIVDAVLVIEPIGAGYHLILFVNLRSSRDTNAFSRDARYRKLWVKKHLLSRKQLFERLTILDCGKE